MTRYNGSFVIGLLRKLAAALRRTYHGASKTLGNTQRRHRHVAFWAWEQREQITVISSRASGTEELTNPGTWGGGSKSVLPDRKVSAAKKKKKTLQKHRLLLFSCPTLPQKVEAFGLSSCTLMSWFWDLKPSYQLYVPKRLKNLYVFTVSATSFSHMLI